LRWRGELKDLNKILLNRREAAHLLSCDYRKFIKIYVDSKLLTPFYPPGEKRPRFFYEELASLRERIRERESLIHKHRERVVSQPRVFDFEAVSKKIYNEMGIV